jgi:hypothetical protein
MFTAGAPRAGPVMELALDDFDREFAVITRGLWLCARAAVKVELVVDAHTFGSADRTSVRRISNWFML